MHTPKESVNQKDIHIFNIHTHVVCTYKCGIQFKFLTFRSLADGRSHTHVGLKLTCGEGAFLWCSESNFGCGFKGLFSIQHPAPCPLNALTPTSRTGKGGHQVSYAFNMIQHMNQVPEHFQVAFMS